MNKEIKCTLPDNELIEKAKCWVDRLCKSGGNAWSLQVPVNFKEDPDIIFSEVIQRFEAGAKDKDEEMVAFAGWCADKYFRYDGVWVVFSKSGSDGHTLKITTAQLLEKFRDEQSKITKAP